MLETRENQGRKAAGEAAGSGWRWTLPVLAAIVLTVVLPRLVVLHVSVIDWDESIYALIAQQWVEGNVPHSTVYDHKPIGLFAIFAAFFVALGDTILSIRLIPIVFVAATAAVLARIAALQFGADRWLAALAAATYGLLTLANGGLATNTEILVNLFVVLAMHGIVSFRLDREVSVPGSLVAGASLGMAFQVNFLSGVLVVGVAAAYFLLLPPGEPRAARIRRWVSNGALMFAAFLLVGVALHLPVFLYGDIADFVRLKFAYLQDYEGVGDFATALRRISESVLAHAPFHALFIVLAASAAWAGRAASRQADGAGVARDRRVLAWIAFTAFALAAALASRRFYHHFFLLLGPGFTMLTVAFLQLRCPEGAMRRTCALWLLLMAGFSIFAAQEEFVRGVRAAQRVGRGQPADNVVEAAQFMTPRLQRGETIYVYDGQPILYFLTRTVPPTRFAFPEAHLREDVAMRFGSTPEEAVRRILESRPRFIIADPASLAVDGSRAAAVLRDVLQREYAPARGRGGGPANVFERMD
jgi:hypothetical protein